MVQVEVDSLAKAEQRQPAIGLSVQDVVRVVQVAFRQEEHVHVELARSAYLQACFVLAPDVVLPKVFCQGLDSGKVGVFVLGIGEAEMVEPGFLVVVVAQHCFCFLVCPEVMKPTVVLRVYYRAFDALHCPPCW